MDLKRLTTSCPMNGLLINKSKPTPVACLDKKFVMDTKEFPIFGGDLVDPMSYIVYGADEDSIDIIQRIALSRGAIKIHYDDYMEEKKGIKVFMDNITERNKNLLDATVFNNDSFKHYEQEKYYLGVMQYFQHKRNHLWKKKMVALEYEYRQDCFAKYCRPSLVELNEKINLFKARMIVCERFLCLHTYGLPGRNYNSWEDYEPFSFTCPTLLFDKWLKKMISIIMNQLLIMEMINVNVCLHY
jgi:hypothetical protein